MLCWLCPGFYLSWMKNRKVWISQPCTCNAFQNLSELGQSLLGKTDWPWDILFSPVSSFPLPWSGLEKCLALLLMGATKLPLVNVNLNCTSLVHSLPPLLPQFHLHKSSVIFLCLVTSPHSCILHPSLVYFFSLITLKPITIFQLVFREVFPGFFSLECVPISFFIKCHWLPTDDIHLDIHLNGNVIFVMCLFLEETGPAFICPHRKSSHFLTKLFPEAHIMN